MDKSDGQLKTDRTLGQVAYEAHAQWNNYATPWAEISMAARAEWEHVAQAVAPIAGFDDR